MIDQSSRDEMARIMALMNESAEPSNEVLAKVRGVQGVVPNAELSHLPPAVADMKAILETIQRSSNEAVESLSETSKSDRELREALATEQTPDGARIGEWEIRTHTEGRRKMYDVARVGESTVIAADLTLYEAAHGLVRILNAGGAVNSRDAMGLLNAEQSYTGAVASMVQFKHLIEGSKASAKRAVYEDRYGEAKRKALVAREKIAEMVRSGRV